MAQIRIIAGEYRNKPVIDTVFTMVKGLQEGARGSFVTVRNDGQFNIDIDVVKVKVDSSAAIEYLDGEAETHVDAKNQEVSVVVTKPTETDEEAMDRIATRFGVLDEMSGACIAGNIRAMIVTGPPGVGKSHGVITQMEKASMFDNLKGKKPRFNIVKGAISGIGLFATLYKYSDKKNVLVFDDCDVWEDQDALNVLKGALDSGKNRRISWNKDSRLLREEGVPNEFNFNGSVIFITNLNLQDRKSAKIKAHIEALQSRCHYLDLTINSERDKMLRIRQVHRDAGLTGGLFADYDFSAEQANEILDFMWENHTKLREVSLRCALKIADLVKISANWRTLAKATICR